MTEFLQVEDVVGRASALTIGSAPEPLNMVTLVQYASTVPGINAAVAVTRVADLDEDWQNPKAFRVRTEVTVDTDSNEWVISGELNSYNNSTSPNASGSCALSGVANKYGTSPIFGGHVQAKDWNIYETPEDVTSLIGLEVNTPAVGPDHPSLNDGHGARIGIDLIARTNPNVPGAADAEIGVGLRVRTDGSSGGHFRTGILVNEDDNNPNSIGTGVQINTSGDYGLKVVGSNGVAAVGLRSGQKIALEGTGVITMYHAPAPNRIIMANGDSCRVSFDVSASPKINVLGKKVVGERLLGWSPMAGTSIKGGFDTATIDLPHLAQVVKAVVDAMTTHGLVGSS